MKRGALLLAIVFGLALLDWSCSPIDPCGGNHDPGVAKLFSLNNVYHQRGFNQSEPNKYYNHQFKLSGDIRFVGNSSPSLFGQSAYACSIAEPRGLVLSEMRVTCDKPYSTDADANLALLFLENEFDVFRVGDEMTFQDTSILTLQMPPDLKDTFQFTIQLLDFEGRILETVTDKVLISP